MKLDIPPTWRHDFKISSCGKYITLELFIPSVSAMVGYRAKRITIRAMFDAFQFNDRKTQQTLIRLLEELNKKYYSIIEIFPK